LTSPALASNGVNPIKAETTAAPKTENLLFIFIFL
jgi:hypothetical protein